MARTFFKYSTCNLLSIVLQFGGCGGQAERQDSFETMNRVVYDVRRVWAAFHVLYPKYVRIVKGWQIPD